MSLAFRAYFALPDTLATSTGVVTNAVHGFTSMLVYLIREQRPSALAVAFDAPGRHLPRRDARGLQGRPGRDPRLLPPQFDMIREVMAALAIPVVEAPGFEADDVIATLATEAAERQCEVVIVTGDRDSFQLVQDPYVRVLYNKRGVSDYALYDEAGIFERTGVPPSQYVLLASLRGDPSDNLPGVPGVGEKTAAKLLTNYGDLDGIFANLDALTPKLRENLAANEELARSNARIIPLVRDVPLEVDVDHLDARCVGPCHGGGHLRTLRDEDGVEPPGGAARRRRAGRARARQCGPGAKGAEAAVAAATSGHPAPAEPAAPPFELREVALPTTAAEVTKQLSELGSGPPGAGGPLERHARAQRAGGPRRRRHRGRRGRPGGAGAGGPARCGLGGQEAHQPCWPARSSATRSRRPCARCCRSASTSPASRWTPAVAAYLLDASTGEYELVAAARADRAAQPRHRGAR